MDPDGGSLLFRAIPPECGLSAEAKRLLKDFARTLSNRIAEGRAFTCLITNDKELRKLNNTFLGHDYATDVLSFPSQEKGDLGELAISAERASAQAREFGHTLSDEIRILMLHGILHLTGLDHEKDRGKMARAERKWRAEFGLPDTLIARTRARLPANQEAIL